MTTLVSSGLDYPTGLAVNGAGNVIIADSGNDAIKKWISTEGTLITLIASDSVFGGPIHMESLDSVAVDAAGNVYFNNSFFEPLENHSVTRIRRWNVASNTFDIVADDAPGALAVDPGGDVYYGNPIKRWNRTDHTVTTLGPPMGVTQQVTGMAVDSAGRVVFADTSNAIRTLIPAYVDRTPRTENFIAGNGLLPEVVPAIAMLHAVPVSDQPWLTITGNANGVVAYAFAQNTRPVNRQAGITVLGEQVPVWQGCAPALGTNRLWEGPGAGSDSVMLNTIYPPTVTAGAAWLHPLPAGEPGDSLVRFTFDANPGPTRSATLTIAGQILTVTQAGSAYIAAPTPLTTLAAGLAGMPHTVAVDGAGNVIIGTSDYAWDSGWIGKWNPATNTVTTLVSSGLSGVMGLTLDGAGDIYASSVWDGAVKKWHPANGSLTTMFSSPDNFYPMGVAVDAEANIYFADALSGGIRKWIAATDSLVTQSSEGYQGVAIDVAGNLYCSNYGTDGSLTGGSSKWNACSGKVSRIATDQRHNAAVVDGSGNHYFITTDDRNIRRWNAATQTISPKLVPSGLNYPEGIAVDSTGNIYIADTMNYAVKEQVRAFVDPTPRVFGLAAGSGTLSQVLPASQNLRAPFAPTSDQPWLTITGVANGIVGFSYSATTSTRTAHINLLGQTIAIIQDPQATPPGDLISLAGTSVITDGGGQKSLQMSVLCSDANATLTLLSTTDLTLPLGAWDVIAITPTDAGAGCSISPSRSPRASPGDSSGYGRFSLNPGQGSPPGSPPEEARSKCRSCLTTAQICAAGIVRSA
jgi:sugar lactone lactonase YvrE